MATHPARHLPVLLRPTRIRNLEITIVPVHKILQNGSTLPDFQLGAVTLLVDEGRDTAVGVDIEEPLLLLLVFEEFDWADLCKNVGQSYSAAFCS